MNEVSIRAISHELRSKNVPVSGVGMAALRAMVKRVRRARMDGACIFFGVWFVCLVVVDGVYWRIVIDGVCEEDVLGEGFRA